MTTERFEARVSPFKTGMLVVGALGFVVAGIWMIRSGDPQLIKGVVPAYVAGWAATLFFGAMALVGGRQLFRSEPVLRIGREGVRWSRWSDSVIPWAAIERASEMSIQRQRFVALWLRDPGAYRSSTLMGRLQGANKAMGFGDIALTTQGTDRRFDDMVAAVRAHAPQLFR